MLTRRKQNRQKRNAAEFNSTVAGINSPGDQTGTVGVAKPVVLSGAELVGLTQLKPLPKGLSLKPVSESEWIVEGAPEEPGVTEVELQAEGAAEVLNSVHFSWTVAAAEKEPPPPPAPPTRDGHSDDLPRGRLLGRQGELLGTDLVALDVQHPVAAGRPADPRGDRHHLCGAKDR